MVAILVSPPQAEPVSRVEAKNHARIDLDDDDALIDSYIKAARTEVENRTGRALVTQGWRIVRDGVPRGGVIRLTPAPVARVDAVTIYNGDGVASIVDPAEYTADTHSAPGRLKLGAGHLQLAAGRFWGSRAMNGIEIDITCGYGDPDDVPAPLKHAILMLVAYWYEQREAADMGTVVGPVMHGVASLTAPYRMPRLA